MQFINFVKKIYIKLQTDLKIKGDKYVSSSDLW